MELHITKLSWVSTEPFLEVWTQIAAIKEFHWILLWSSSGLTSRCHLRFWFNSNLPFCFFPYNGFVSTWVQLAAYRMGHLIPLSFPFIQITGKILVKSRPHFSLWFLFSRKKMSADPLNLPQQRGGRFGVVLFKLVIFPFSNCFPGRWSTEKRELCHLVIDYSFSLSHSPHLFHMTFTKASMMLYSSVSRERKCLAIRDPFVSSQIILFLLSLSWET